MVLDGYTRLGLTEARHVIEEVVAPLAAAESAWRSSLRDGTIETFFDSYPASRLPDDDDRIELHDAERVRLVRTTPAAGCRRVGRRCVVYGRFTGASHRLALRTATTTRRMRGK